jgi:hypothetical protein
MTAIQQSGTITRNHLLTWAAQTTRPLLLFNLHTHLAAAVVVVTVQ